VPPTVAIDGCNSQTGAARHFGGVGQQVSGLTGGGSEEKHGTG